MTIDSQPLPGGIGREVSGVEATRAIPDADQAALRALWAEAGLLLFRRAAASSEALLTLSRVFGTLEPHPIAQLRLPDHPELILLTNRDGPSGPVYDFGAGPIHGRIPWHTDLAFKVVPNAGALLRMVRRTADGGQTGWIDTAAAWDALDPDMQARIAGLEARYDFRKELEGMRFDPAGGTRIGARRSDFPDYPPIRRPLVWTHPATGRTILNLSLLNIDSIIGMPPADGDALIQALLDHVTGGRFSYVHDWANDDVMLWDNYRMLHSAFGHPVDQVRIVERSTLKGEAAVGEELALA